MSNRTMEALMEWQPIETHDGSDTPVLLWRAGWTCAPVARKVEVNDDAADGTFTGWQFADENLHIRGAMQEGFIGWNEDAPMMPTHWRPAPPQEDRP